MVKKVDKANLLYSISWRSKQVSVVYLVCQWCCKETSSQS